MVRWREKGLVKWQSSLNGRHTHDNGCVDKGEFGGQGMRKQIRKSQRRGMVAPVARGKYWTA